MKLEKAMELGRQAGLDTYEEAVYNIRLHAIQLFTRGELEDELKELDEDYENWKRNQ